MEILLKYHYGIINPCIIRNIDNFLIKCNKTSYYLYEFNKIDEIISINEILNNYKIEEYFYKLKKTKKNELTINYNNKQYILIEQSNNKTRNMSQHLNDLKKIKIDISNKKYSCLTRTNWYYLWKNKNDYYLNDKKKDDYGHKNEMIDYYIGMAETAIQYIKEVQGKYNINNLYISHKRVNNETYENPLNIVLDVPERDIAEYIKYLYFAKNYNNSTSERILEIIKRNNMSTEIIYARLIYPTYYFDLFESTESIDNINKTKQIYETIEKYEQFLKEIYLKFNKIKPTKKIDWL